MILSAYVPLRRSVVAVASVLNALEGITKEDMVLDERMDFIDAITKAIDYDICSPLVNAVRVRLLESFAKSSGCELPQAGLMPATDSKPEACNEAMSSSMRGEEEDVGLDTAKYYEDVESPVCVKDMSVSLENDTWRDHNSI